MEDNNTKEINLMQLINLFFNWLKKVILTFINFLGYLAQLIFRHKIVLAVSILVCLAYGLYLSRPSAKIYKAEALVMIYGSETQNVKEVCKELENSINSNNFYSLASKLSLPDSITQNIVSIQSFYVIDYLKDGVADMVDYKNSRLMTDTSSVRMKDRFCLQIKTKKINQIPKVQAAIINFFNNNTKMKNEFEARKNGIIKQINICDAESKRIDSLAKVSYFRDANKQLQFDKDKLIIGEQRKQLFYDDLIRLNDIKAYNQSKLVDFKQPVDLPSGFVVYPIPENGSLKYGLFGILAGFIISVILSIFIENLKKISKFLENK